MKKLTKKDKIKLLTIAHQRVGEYFYICHIWENAGKFGLDTSQGIMMITWFHQQHTNVPKKYKGKYWNSHYGEVRDTAFWLWPGWYKSRPYKNVIKRKKKYIKYLIKQLKDE